MRFCRAISRRCRDYRMALKRSLRRLRRGTQRGDIRAATQIKALLARIWSTLTRSISALFMNCRPCLRMKPFPDTICRLHWRKSSRMCPSFANPIMPQHSVKAGGYMPRNWQARLAFIERRMSGSGNCPTKCGAPVVWSRIPACTIMVGAEKKPPPVSMKIQPWRRSTSRRKSRATLAGQDKRPLTK